VPTVEVSLPQDVYAQFERMVDEQFVTEEEAVEELLSAGLDAYTRDTSGDDRATDMADEYADEMWDTAEDPAGEPDDDRL
jgi:metal-responsive CopG/Arc/MetJ family transcriptional regulator